LSNTLFYRHVPFTDSVTTLRRLAPGDYRFKVFPDDILFEPADLVLDADAVAKDVLVRVRMATSLT